MSLSDIASIGEFVSGIAVLVSLIYLALQIRQTEKNQRAIIDMMIADTPVAGSGDFAGEYRKSLAAVMAGSKASAVPSQGSLS